VTPQFLIEFPFWRRRLTFLKDIQLAGKPTARCLLRHELDASQDVMESESEMLFIE
jgi:hypothetical protein